MKFLPLAILLATAAFAAEREVAITIDDLPLGGAQRVPCTADGVVPLTRKLLSPFEREKLPVIGFVNAGRCEKEMTPADLQRVLNTWLDAGADLGNHTFSHPSLNTTPLPEYIANIERGEPAIKQALDARGKKLRYFRHPFLFAGKDRETRQGLETYLAEHNYTIAPVTIDNSDWMFAAVYAQALKRGDTALAEKTRAAYLPYMESMFDFFESRSKEVAGHEIRQILLIHVSELNADTMPDLLAMMKRRGYKIVSLDRALEDPAYQLPNEYYGKGGFSWVHRWSRTKSMPAKGEADPPEWIEKAFAELTRP